jgi:hypothetical protein
MRRATDTLDASFNVSRGDFDALVAFLGGQVSSELAVGAHVIRFWHGFRDPATRRDSCTGCGGGVAPVWLRGVVWWAR